VAQQKLLTEEEKEQQKNLALFTDILGLSSYPEWSVFENHLKEALESLNDLTVPNSLDELKFTQGQIDGLMYVISLPYSAKAALDSHAETI
jgi:hypothetical protein